MENAGNSGSGSKMGRMKNLCPGNQSPTKKWRETIDRSPERGIAANFWRENYGKKLKKIRGGRGFL